MCPPLVAPRSRGGSGALVENPAAGHPAFTGRKAYGYNAGVEYRPYKGWQRLTEEHSWGFLLGDSPFSYEEDITSMRREGNTHTLVWLHGKAPAPEQDTPVYPANFTFYLSRLLLNRDSRCAAWWSGAANESGDALEVLFARFEASVAAALARDWVGREGPLAAALLKRFGNRFPFDAATQVRLLFSQLPDVMLRDSFFDQSFSTDRDELVEVFLVMDTDGDGVISSEDIRKVFEQKMGGMISHAEIQQMLKEAFANRAGEIDFAGFKEAIYRSYKAESARSSRGLPDEDWWRDPTALLPVDMQGSPQLISEAQQRFSTVLRRRLAKQRANDSLADATDAEIVDACPPLQREGPLNLLVYLLFTAAGALSCTLTHVVLVPIDVVKTLQQTEPKLFGGLGTVEAVAHLWRHGGPRSLLLGLVPTLIGYTWYGATVFPGYEFFKRRLMGLCGPRLGARLRVPLVLLSGALATFFACLGVCPAEAVRIRTVTEHGFRHQFLKPVTTLYAGFAPLLFRQVLFGMAKFLVFDTFAAQVYRRFPGLARRRHTALLVSLASGATAGLVATLVSQPSDAILTKLAPNPQLGISGAAAALWAEGGASAFFAGLGTRAVWAAAIIAGQFLLYDVAKTFFRVTGPDLTQTADPITTALRNSESVRLKDVPSVSAS